MTASVSCSAVSPVTRQRSKPGPVVHVSPGVGPVSALRRGSSWADPGDLRGREGEDQKGTVVSHVCAMPMSTQGVDELGGRGASPGWSLTPWRDWALCRSRETNLWFPDDSDGVHLAVAICSYCPVRLDCLEWALENNEVFGVWGGASARHRERMQVLRRRRRRTPSAGTSPGASSGAPGGVVARTSTHNR